MLDHIPAFVDEIIAALYPDAAPLPTASAHASEHGAQRLGLRFDVAEVVREYGLLHECILELAGDSGLQITLKEQQVVLKWLNSGIADALAQYVKRRDQELERQTSEHLGFIAHELRNPLSAARAAVHRLRSNEADRWQPRRRTARPKPAAHHRHDRQRAVARVAASSAIDPTMEPLALADLLRDIELDAGADAQARGVDLIVAAPGGTVISADPRMLRSAVFNLVQNALKFSRAGSTVTISVGTAPGSVTIEVADACGGLPPGKIEDLFSPTVQRGGNRSGIRTGPEHRAPGGRGAPWPDRGPRRPRHRLRVQHPASPARREREPGSAAAHRT